MYSLSVKMWDFCWISGCMEIDAAWDGGDQYTMKE